MSDQQQRATLDDPELESRVRYEKRSSTYYKRPLKYHHSNKIDIVRPPAAPKKIVPTQDPGPMPQKTITEPIVPKKDFQPPNIKVQPKPRTYRRRSVQVSVLNVLTKKTLKNTFQKANLLYGAAGLLLIFGVYIGVNGWLANNQVVAQLQHLQNNANSGSSSSDNNNKHRNPIPSTKPISSYSIANYTVAPDLPRYLKIPKIHVYSRVLQVGVTEDGHMGVPPNVYDTAWYTGSDKPGESGATLIDGHLDGYNTEGVFWNLNKLVKGDTVQVIRGDGEVISYKVVKSKVYNIKNVDMKSAMVPVVQGKAGLNLTTCAGDYHVEGGYNKRLIVYATQI